MTWRIRVDTTVVPANVSYPTDSGLLAKAIRRIAAAGKRIQAAGGATRTKLRDRSRAAGQRAHEIAAKLRTRSAAGREEAQATVRRVTGELAELAATAAEQAERLLATRSGRCAGPGPRPTSCANVVCATRWRGGGVAAGPRGQRPDRAAGGDPADRGADPPTRRRASPPTAPPDGSACTTAMPARSPRAGSGARSNSGTRRRSSTTTTGSCWITAVEQGNPPDAPQLAPAVKRVTKRAGRTPRTVTADRGYGEAKVDRQLTDLGVKTW